MLERIIDIDRGCRIVINGDEIKVQDYFQEPEVTFTGHKIEAIWQDTTIHSTWWNPAFLIRNAFIQGMRFALTEEITPELEKAYLPPLKPSRSVKELIAEIKKAFENYEDIDL